MADLVLGYFCHLGQYFRVGLGLLDVFGLAWDLVQYLDCGLNIGFTRVYRFLLAYHYVLKRLLPKTMLMINDQTT
jgi:hypothetical protein